VRQYEMQESQWEPVLVHAQAQALLEGMQVLQAQAYYLGRSC
jgi:hypothetical protein